MGNAVQKVTVIGHKNPDTDSICSAIAYAELKNRLGEMEYEPRRAGKLNQETQFVLRHFNVPVPRMCTDVSPKLRNVEYRKVDGVPRYLSMRDAWEIMRDQVIDTLPVIEKDGRLAGLVSVKDIAIANMDVFDNTILATSKTTYRNILKTLNGEMLVGSIDGVTDPRARVIIGASSPDVMENTLLPGDIVMLGNRYESQLCAIEMGASLIIICNGGKIGVTVRKLAEMNGVSVMSVPYDTYAAGKLISMCPPVSSIMTSENLLQFTVVTPVEDAIDVMAKVRFRYFPILDEEGRYCGMVSRRNLIKLSKRKVILVDHNESTQAVDGLDQAEILEIIDHHRLGDLQTSGPLYFRSQPIGATATIIAQMYAEHRVEMPDWVAGLLLSAILSDTLKFTSPTCTPLDKQVAKDLAGMAGVDIDTYAAAMFEAGENLEGTTAEELLMRDFKVFMCGDTRFGVAQGNFVTRSNIQVAQSIITPGLEEARIKQNVEDIYVLLTDISESITTALCSGPNAKEILCSGFNRPAEEDGSVILPGVVSRKKQFIPNVMDAYQRRW